MATTTNTVTTTTNTATPTVTPVSTEWKLLQKSGLKCAAGLGRFYGKSGQSIDQICLNCGESPIDMGCVTGIGGGGSFYIDEPLYNVTWHNQHWNSENIDEFIRFMDKGKAADAVFGGKKIEDVQKTLKCDNGIYGFDADIYTSPDGASKKIANFQPLCSSVKNNTITTTTVPVVPPVTPPEEPVVHYVSDVTVGTDSTVIPIVSLNTSSSLEKFSEVNVFYIPEDNKDATITIPIVNPDMKVDSDNAPYFELPLLDSSKSAVIVSHYVDSNNGINQVNYKANTFTAQEIRDLVNKDSAALYDHQLEIATVKLPIEQSLFGDIVTYTHIPVAEGKKGVVKKVGIKSDGTIVDISHRNLYLLLLLVLVLVLVMYTKSKNNQVTGGYGGYGGHYKGGNWY